MTNRFAPKRLDKYIKSYDSPFPQNVRYFLALTTKLGLANCNVDERSVLVRDLLSIARSVNISRVTNFLKC